MNLIQKTTNTHFVPDLRSCILGVYDENVDNVKIINTVMLLVKMYIMNCKYDWGVLSRVAFVRIFMYKVMLLGRLYENDVFVQLAQMFGFSCYPYVECLLIASAYFWVCNDCKCT